MPSAETGNVPLSSVSYLCETILVMLSEARRTEGPFCAVEASLQACPLRQWLKHRSARKGYVGTAALGCPVERSSKTLFIKQSLSCRAKLRAEMPQRRNAVQGCKNIQS